MTADEVAKMAKTDEFVCEKCGEDQESKRSLGQHRRHCKGKSDEAPAARRSPARSTKDKAATSTTMALIPIVAQVPDHLKGSDLEPAVQRLLDRKKALEDERLEIDRAINQLSRLPAVEAESRPT